MRGRIKTDHDLNRYAHMLVREERRLTRLVNNLLAYSRVTDVTEVYSFEALEPAALISEATQGFRRQLTDGAIRLEVEAPAGRSGGSRRPDGDCARARQSDRQRDPIFRRGENGVRARLG